MLLQGHKFDLRCPFACALSRLGRLYVLLVQPEGGEYQLYLCPEGLVRVCTEPYNRPTVKNLHKLMGHLTNSSLNAQSDKYVAAGSANDAESGSKRTMSAVMAQLAQVGLDTGQLWAALGQLCAESVWVMLPGLNAARARTQAASGGLAGGAFQVLGVDVLLGEDARPHLMEVNANPSIALYHTSSPDEPVNPVDMAVKRAVVAGALAVVLGHSHPDCPVYEPLDMPECDTVWHRMAQAYSQAVGGAHELTGNSFRRLLHESGVAPPLIADEVFRQMRHQMNEQYKGIGLEAFFDMVKEIACKRHRDSDELEALQLICESFE